MICRAINEKIVSRFFLSLSLLSIELSIADVNVGQVSETVLNTGAKCLFLWAYIHHIYTFVIIFRYYITTNTCKRIWAHLARILATHYTSHLGL